MNWTLFWTFFLQIMLFVALFPVIGFLIGWGIDYIIRPFRAEPTDRMILYGASSDD